MPRGRLLPFLVVTTALLGAAAGTPAGAGSADAAKTRERVEALRQRIGRVQEQLAAERQRRDTASHELARIEQRAGELASRMAALDRRISETRDRIGQLRQRRRELASELTDHRETLAAQLRAAYRLGRRPGLRLLLGQDDPAAAARALGYYAYFNEARIGAMERANSLLDEIGAVAREAHAAEQQLRSDRQALTSRRQELERVRAERAQRVARLNRSIADGDAQLDALRQQRRRLKSLLDEIGSVLADTRTAPWADEPFASRSGALPWPVAGPLRARYGSARADGRLQWQGMVIAADMGAPVRAVHHGRVVFADWLSGFGHLIIVDHQDGHLTLYGYNERLLRGAGDWVAPGEPIARVGDSGGRDRPGLYFEIRRQGKPVDPMPWLAARQGSKPRRR